MDTTTIQPGDKIRTARGWFTVTDVILPYGFTAYMGLDKLTELIRPELVIGHEQKENPLDQVGCASNGIPNRRLGGR